MSPISESDHRRLEATFFPDKCVVEVHRVSDASRGLRRCPVTKVWRTDRLLGRGGSGEVHLQSQDPDKNDKRALKVIHTKRGVNLSLADCQRELTALIEFTKPKYKDAAVFVDFFGWFQDNDAMFLAMEYMPLGDLEHNIQGIERSLTHAGPPLSEGEIQEITCQILEGLKIMHAEGFAHRDLKPQNVFVVRKHPQWWIKLGDFGLAKKRTDGTAYRTQAGTQQYMAPELFYYVQGLNTETSEYTSAIDLWSLGCIIYRIMTRRVPFLGLLDLKKYCMSPSNALLNMPSSMKEGGDFVKRLLMPHPANRPLAREALESTWLTTKIKPEVALSEQQVKPAAQNMSQSQNNYNTASHRGLQSLYHIPTTNNPPTIPSANEPLPDPLPSPTSESTSLYLTALPQVKSQKVAENLTAPIDYLTSTLQPAAREEAWGPSENVSALQPVRSSVIELRTTSSQSKALPHLRKPISVRVQAQQKERQSQSKPFVAVKSRPTGRELASQLLLLNGFDVMRTDLNKEKALNWAAREGHEAVTQLLLEMGANIEAKDTQGMTALHRAAWKGHEGVAELLLKNQADIEAKSLFKETALHSAAYGGHKSVAELLLKNQADIEAKNEYKRTALHRAASNGHKDVVELLLKNNAKIEAKDQFKGTALLRAARKGHDDVVELLLQNQADIKAKDKDLMTTLHWAALKGHEGVVELLLKNQADMEAKDIEIMTALHWSAREGHEGVAELLLKNQADIEAKDEHGATALHWAAREDHEGVVELLLKNRADIEAKDKSNRKASQVAATFGHEAVVKLLKQARPLRKRPGSSIRDFQKSHLPS